MQVFGTIGLLEGHMNNTIASFDFKAKLGWGGQHLDLCVLP